MRDFSSRDTHLATFGFVRNLYLWNCCCCEKNKVILLILVVIYKTNLKESFYLLYGVWVKILCLGVYICCVYISIYNAKKILSVWEEFFKSFFLAKNLILFLIHFSFWLFWNQPTTFRFINKGACNFLILITLISTIKTQKSNVFIYYLL